jgi:hypothetical protein
MGVPKDKLEACPAQRKETGSEIALIPHDARMQRWEFPHFIRREGKDTEGLKNPKNALGER